VKFLAMLLSLLSLGAAMSGADYCAQFSNTDCATCLENPDNYTHCGFCLTDRKCLPGDARGPFISHESCSDVNASQNWLFNRKSDKCKQDSSIAFPLNVRIGVGVAVGVIAIATLVFWVWIFPCLFARKDSDAVINQDY
jgi:hypothetical protein